MKNTMTPEQQKMLASLNTSLLGSLFTSGGGAATQGTVTPTGTAPATAGVTPGVTPSFTPPTPYYNTMMNNMTTEMGLGNMAVSADDLNAMISGVPKDTSLAGAPVYPGDMTAGPSAIQNQLFGSVSGLLGGLGGDKTANSALDAFLNRYKGGYQTRAFDPTSTLNMFQKSVYDPAMKGFNEQTLPQIAEMFAGRGSFDSGGTLYEMTRAGSDLASSLAGTKASMLDSARTSWDNMELNKFLNINSMIPSLAGAKTSSVTSGLAGLPYAMGLGETQQGLSQADINEMVTKWTSGQPYSNPYLNLLPLALGTSAITPVVQGGTTGLLGAIAPGVGAGIGSYLGAGNTLASLLAS